MELAPQLVTWIISLGSLGVATNLRGYFRGDPTHILGFEGEARGPIEPGQTFVFGGDRKVFPNDGHAQMRLRGAGDNDFILTWVDSYGEEQLKTFPVEEMTGRGNVDESNLPSQLETNVRFLPIQDPEVR